MNVKIENIEKNVIQLEIEVESEKFEEGMKKAFAKNASKFNVPGFRKGKAPRKVIERYYGESVLYEDAINIICPEVYDEAVEQNNLFPVDKPEIDIKQIGNGENFIFTAKVSVKPDVELGEYKGIELNNAKTMISEDDVEKEFKALIEKHARIENASDDKPIENGDIAVIDFEGFIDGEAFEGGKASYHSLEIGSGSFIPGFEDQLIGAKAGDDVEVNISFPEDYAKEDLKGKPALFKVYVNEVKVKQLPEIDDEFAKDISEFDTIAEYKEDLKNKLIERAEKMDKSQLENELLQKIADAATVEIPEAMIRNQIEVLVRDFDMKLRYQGLDIKKYMELYGINENGLIEQFRERAERDVKVQLVVDKIGEVENIELTDEDLAAGISKIAKDYKQEEEEFKKLLKDDDIEYIKRDLMVEKTLKFLMENAKLV